MIDDMNVDFYDIGFVPSVPINGGHWYGDPFNLFTDYGISRISEPYFADSYPVVAYSTSTFFYIGNVDPAPTPVPEPSSLLLLFLAVLVYLGRRAAWRPRYEGVSALSSASLWAAPTSLSQFFST